MLVGMPGLVSSGLRLSWFCDVEHLRFWSFVRNLTRECFPPSSPSKTKDEEILAILVSQVLDFEFSNSLHAWYLSHTIVSSLVVVVAPKKQSKKQKNASGKMPTPTTKVQPV